VNEKTRVNITAKEQKIELLKTNVQYLSFNKISKLLENYLIN
jgi:hypothetical protein